MVLEDAWAISRAFDGRQLTSQLSCLATNFVDVLGNETVLDQVYYDHDITVNNVCSVEQGQFAPWWQEDLIADHYRHYAAADQNDFLDQRTRDSLFDFSEVNTLRLCLWTTLGAFLWIMATWHFFASSSHPQSDSGEGRANKRNFLWTLGIIEITVLMHLFNRDPHDLWNTGFGVFGAAIIGLTFVLMYFPLSELFNTAVAIFTLMYIPAIGLAALYAEDVAWQILVGLFVIVGVFGSFLVRVVFGDGNSSVASQSSDNQSAYPWVGAILLFGTIVGITIDTAVEADETVAGRAASELWPVTTIALSLLVFWFGGSVLHRRLHITPAEFMGVELLLGAIGFLVGIGCSLFISFDPDLCAACFTRSNFILMLYFLAFLCLLQWSVVRLRSALRVVGDASNKKDNNVLTWAHRRQHSTEAVAISLLGNNLVYLLALLLAFEAAQLASVEYAIAAFLMFFTVPLRTIVEYVANIHHETYSKSRQTEGKAPLATSALVFFSQAVIVTRVLTITDTNNTEVARRLWLPYLYARGRHTVQFQALMLVVVLIAAFGVAVAVLLVRRHSPAEVSPNLSSTENSTSMAAPAPTAIRHRRSSWQHDNATSAQHDDYQAYWRNGVERPSLVSGNVASVIDRYSNF